MKYLNNKIIHSYINFFNNVMMYLRLHDWELNFTIDSYCWINDKRIDIDVFYKGDIRQLILHEIAHINSAKYCNQKHNHEYWKFLEFLIKKFLHSDLDDNQKKIKSYSTKGFYSLNYL